MGSRLIVLSMWTAAAYVAVSLGALVGASSAPPPCLSPIALQAAFAKFPPSYAVTAWDMPQGACLST